MGTEIEGAIQFLSPEREGRGQLAEPGKSHIYEERVPRKSCVVLDVPPKLQSLRRRLRRSNIQIFLTSNSLILCWCCPLGKTQPEIREQGSLDSAGNRSHSSEHGQAEERAEMSLEEDYPVQFPSKEHEYCHLYSDYSLEA